MTVVAVLLAIVWFATVGAREGAAREFDDSAISILQREIYLNNYPDGKDYGAAYRKAEFADALRPTEARQLTLGSLAYLNGDYEAAQRQFARVGGPEKTRGLIGLMAAAGQAGDDDTYQKAKRKLAAQTDPQTLSEAAFAAIAAGDLDGARDILGNQDSEEISRLGRTIANLNDPVTAGRLLVQPERSLSFGHDPYGQFAQKLTATPEDAEDVLASAISQAQTATSSGSKKVILAQGLLKLGYYRAAAGLAESSVQTEPLYRDGWQVVAACQITLDQTKQAERSLKTALDLDPASGYTWFLKSQLAEKQQDSEDAAEFRDKAKIFGYSA